MSGRFSLLVENTWLAIGLALGAFLVLFAVLQICARAGSARPETTRKLLHTGSGLLTLAFPFLFHEVWPVLLLTGASALLVASVKFLPVVRARLGGVTDRVERRTLGELYFPLSVALLFWLTRGDHPLLFVVPVLMLTLADATSGLVGGRYGLTRYSGASKSLEGSVAFVIVGFFCVHVPLLLWSSVGRTESLLIGATLALLVMLLEGSAWRGLDNLFIPIGGYFLLRAYLPMDAAALLARLIVTSALVLLIVVSRRRTTLEDDSLVAAAFLSYVAWAIMGWEWLVAPMVIFVGYAWLSPPTADNSRRMHGVPAVLSIWSAAVAWLALANATGRSTLLFPYSIVFAAHLAMFGVSRLAHQFPERRLASLFWRAVCVSWLLVMAPFLAVAGATAPNLAAAAAGLGAIALGAASFVLSQPTIRDAPQDARRWVRQAGAASIASIAAWAAVAAVSRVLP
jgi:phytol kinase